LTNLEFYCFKHHSHPPHLSWVQTVSHTEFLGNKSLFSCYYDISHNETESVWDTTLKTVILPPPKKGYSFFRLNQATSTTSSERIFFSSEVYSWVNFSLQCVQGQFYYFPSTDKSHTHCFCVPESKYSATRKTNVVWINVPDLKASKDGSPVRFRIEFFFSGFSVTV
jgi:hypothetical protein